MSRLSTWYELKMVGCKFLMSKVGITTLVRVWCNLLSPSFSFISLCRYCPSYWGPVKAFHRFTIDANGPLYSFRNEKKKEQFNLVFGSHCYHLLQNLEKQKDKFESKIEMINPFVSNEEYHSSQMKSASLFFFGRYYLTIINKFYSWWLIS